MATGAAARASAASPRGSPRRAGLPAEARPSSGAVRASPRGSLQGGSVQGGSPLGSPRKQLSVQPGSLMRNPVYKGDVYRGDVLGASPSQMSITSPSSPRMFASAASIRAQSFDDAELRRSASRLMSPEDVLKTVRKGLMERRVREVKDTKERAKQAQLEKEKSVSYERHEQFQAIQDEKQRLLEETKKKRLLDIEERQLQAEFRAHRRGQEKAVEKQAARGELDEEPTMKSVASMSTGSRQLSPRATPPPDSWEASASREEENRLERQKLMARSEKEMQITQAAEAAKKKVSQRQKDQEQAKAVHLAGMEKLRQQKDLHRQQELEKKKKVMEDMQHQRNLRAERREHRAEQEKAAAIQAQRQLEDKIYVREKRLEEARKAELKKKVERDRLLTESRSLRERERELKLRRQLMVAGACDLQSSALFEAKEQKAEEARRRHFLEVEERRLRSQTNQEQLAQNKQAQRLEEMAVLFEPPLRKGRLPPGSISPRLLEESVGQRICGGGGGVVAAIAG